VASTVNLVEGQFGREQHLTKCRKPKNESVTLSRKLICKMTIGKKTYLLTHGAPLGYF
jgi:hypothetical protein